MIHDTTKLCCGPFCAECEAKMVAQDEEVFALRQRLADLELVRKSAANFMGLWDAGANDIAILDAATELRAALRKANQRVADEPKTR